MSELTLALTKIGDLLLNNLITTTDSGDSIEKICLAIPDYQRPYKWTAKNANQLLDDIIEAKSANKEVYRVGTLILHRNYNREKQREEHNIVDGLQRIVTFALLLKCLAYEQEDIKLVFLEQKLNDNYYNVNNVVSNFNALKRRIDKYPSKDKEDLLEYVRNNCEMIVVITNDQTEAFQFFDSQNARGKKLYPHDLLKAYHLREMRNIDTLETEKVVKTWEDLDQMALSSLFSDYLYRVKEWAAGNRAGVLDEKTIDMFKGVSSGDNYPYAQFYKGAYSYADSVNNSSFPFVSGMQNLNPFQIDTPIVAGKPFFDYAKHYFDILTDIQNNDKYAGCFINDNEIVKTLDKYFKNGTGNRITRLLFDTAILLYVDRFCPMVPSKTDLETLDQFVVYAFAWAYSMRAQYYNVGWRVAQNYVLGLADKNRIKNSFNIYKTIIGADSPVSLLSTLADMIVMLPKSSIKSDEYENNGLGKKDNDEVYMHYLDFFNKHRFLEAEK